MNYIELNNIKLNHFELNNTELYIREAFKKKKWSYLAELFRQIICTVAEQFRHGANYLTEPQNCPKIPVVLGP